MNKNPTQKTIYLDHAAATPVNPEVFKAMKPYFTEKFGNASSIYKLGRISRDAMEQSRKKIASILNCLPEEIIFTAGGTESDNLAIFGVIRQLLLNQKQPLKIITQKTEHHAVLNSFKRLEKDGIEAVYLDVDEYGTVKLEELEKSLTDNVALVSIMYANNEIGTVQPVREIAKIIKKARLARQNKRISLPVYFHTDACQAAGFLDLNVLKLGADMLSLNGSKIYGPKQAGILFVKKGIVLDPIMHGGGQEKNLRSGTENIAATVGLAKALEIAQSKKEGESKRLSKLRDYFADAVLNSIPKTVLNGHPKERLPNNINVSFLDIEGESALFYLDEAGITASTGSACASESLDPSHVILALGRPYEFAHGSIRFTLGSSTTKKDIDYVLRVLPGIVAKLRSISPTSVNSASGNISHPEAFAGFNAKKLKINQ